VTTEPTPPVAPRDPVVRDLHGVRRVDDYAWMRDTASETTLAHLTAERSWYESATEHLRSLASALTAEMSSRVPPADRSVSWRRVSSSYYTRTPEGSEYAQLCRDLDVSPHDVPGGSPQSQVLLDPAALVDGSSFLKLGVSLVSPDERLLAYSVDRTGDEVYELVFRDLDALTDQPDRVTRSYAGGAWSADSSTFFYLVTDEAGRAHEVRRHRLGTPVATDEVVLTEPTRGSPSRCGPPAAATGWVLQSASYETSEVWLVDAHEPGQAPRLVQPRRQGVLYHVEHARTPDGGAFVVLTDDGATEFRLLLAPLEDGAVAEPLRWRELVPENPLERLHRVDAFASHLVVSLRRDGAPCCACWDWTAHRCTTSRAR
jgi:oligopeptidase B